MLHPARRARLALALAAPLALAGCRGEMVCACAPPGLTLNPASLQLAVGARATVTVSAPPEEGRVRFTWSVLTTPVVVIDSTAADGSRVYVRAVGPGSTVLTVQSGALGTTASVPATVTPAP